MLPPEQVSLFKIIHCYCDMLTFLHVAFPAEYAAYSAAFCFRPIFSRFVRPYQISGLVLFSTLLSLRFPILPQCCGSGSGIRYLFVLYS
jgi:hypothetical protein